MLPTKLTPTDPETERRRYKIVRADTLCMLNALVNQVQCLFEAALSLINLAQTIQRFSQKSIVVNSCVSRASPRRH